MSYQALLFCPDEKITRVVTQVLSDLDFRVEPANEPFAAVKRLMAQHFDAIVVDCDNEQNAALLFKSARNSPPNQNSLLVAVVEGQTGVAKAFRIGAALVLTKPINVEQSKGTLRVARGLLRKADSAKPSALSSVASTPAPSAVKAPLTPKPSVFDTPRTLTPSLPAEKPTFLTTQHEAPPAIAASATSAFELEKEAGPEPDAAEAALIESMHDPVPAALAKSGESASKEYPWQPVSKPAEPMASALRRAAEAAEKGESSGLRLVSKPASSLHTASATAPAPARETRTLKPEVEPIAANAETEKPAPIHKGTIVDEAVAEIPEPQEVAVPTFGMPKESAKSGGGTKKGLLTLLLLLLLAGAGYYGWTTVHPEAKVPFIENLVRKYITHEPTLAPPPAHPTPPKSPESLPMTSAPAAVGNTDNIAKAEEITVEPQAEATHEAAASTAPVTALPTIHTSPALPEKTSLPIVVKNGSAPAVPQHPAASEEAVQAPSLTPQGDTKAIAGLVGSAQAKLPKVAPQTVKISQGVSQGLLIKKVQPVYPRQAVATRTEGSVQLEATINKAGDISNLKVLAGQPVLAQAAVDAVKQWKYQPYYLNGDPVEIQTQVTVTFKLP